MVRVLVGCPTFEWYRYCLDEYAERVQQLSHPEYDVMLVDNSKGEEYSYQIKKRGLGVTRAVYLNNVYERIVASRNILLQKVLDGRYDYFLSLEQDVIPPADVIERLLSHGKEMVSGIYYKIYPVKVRGPDGVVRDKKTLLPLVFTSSDDKNKMHVCYPKDVEGDHFFQIRACGLGCVLISRKVLEKISFRYDPTKNTFDDFLFCNDVIEKGFTIYADTSVKCKHLFLQKGDVFEGMQRTPPEHL